MADSLQLPSAPETEFDVLGSCLAEGLGWWRTVERMGSDDYASLFFNPDLRLVATKMKQISEESGDISATAVADALHGDRAADALVPDVATYLAALQSRSSIRTPSQLQTAIGLLAEKRSSRAYITGIDDIKQRALDGDHPNDTAGALRQLSLDGSVVKEVRRLGPVVGEILERNRIGVPWRAPTGLTELDRALRGGFEPGRCYYIGARPKVGKTTLVLNSVLEALGAGITVVLISLEMGEVELYSKLLSSWAYVEQRKIKDWLDGLAKDDIFSDEEFEALTEARREIDAAPLYVKFAEDIRQGADSVLSVVMSVQAALKPGTPIACYVDYLQLMVRDHNNTRAEVSEYTRKFKLGARELGVTIIAPSQINRQGAEEGMPGPHQLRDSGSIEQDADAVILLNRPSLQDESEPEHVMDVWLALSRIGPSKWVKAFYDGAYSTVMDPKDEWGSQDDGRGDDNEQRTSRERQPRSEVRRRGDDYDDD